MSWRSLTASSFIVAVMTVPVHAGRSASKAKRRMIGWDEILHGALPFPDSTVVMSWQGVSGGLKAAKLGTML